MKSALKNRFKEIYGGFIVDIMKCTKLSYLERIVLNYLCINQDNFSPSYTQIQKNCGTTRQSAVDVIKKFSSLELNLLCVESLGRGKRNTFHLHYDVLIEYLHSPKLTSKASRPAKLTSQATRPLLVNSLDYTSQATRLVLLDSKNRKEIDKEMDRAPPTSHTLKLDAQTPKDLEEKPAKKKTKSKPSQKRKITTWGHDHEFSQIFTLLCSLKPYKAIFDVPTDTKTISAHMANQNWNIAQMTYIVRLFVTKSIGSEDRIKSPRRMLATYVGNGEKYNYAELEKLKPFQGEYI